MLIHNGPPVEMHDAFECRRSVDEGAVGPERIVALSQLLNGDWSLVRIEGEFRRQCCLRLDTAGES